MDWINSVWAYIGAALLVFFVVVMVVKATPRGPTSGDKMIDLTDRAEKMLNRTETTRVVPRTNAQNETINFGDLTKVVVFHATDGTPRLVATYSLYTLDKSVADGWIAKGLKVRLMNAWLHEPTKRIVHVSTAQITEQAT